MNLRQHAMTILQASLAAADPEKLVRQALTATGGRINPAGHCLDLSQLRNVYLLAMGKAGATMARGAEAALGKQVASGIAVVKDGHGAPGHKYTEIIEAAHPLPEPRNAEAGRRIMELASRADEDDLVICLISGGSSALMALPAPGISMGDLRLVTDLLLKSGAGIHEINSVRKHITLGAGGRLAAAAAPARVLTLIISDVIGDRLDVIASGPTVADESTFAQALEALRKYNLVDQAPEVVVSHLVQGVAGTVLETPKPGDPVFARVTNLVLCSNETAVAAAARAAADLGYNVTRKDPLAGEARERAQEFMALVRQEELKRQPQSLPVCVLAGGETTVTVKGRGLGGRAQEFALAAALEMEGMENTMIFAAGTDGTDGPTDAAGALADDGTVPRARALGMDPGAFLANNDSYRFFSRLGDLIITGPTGTNVNDIYCALLWV